MGAAVGDEGGSATGVADGEVQPVADGGALGDDRPTVEVDHATGIGGDERLGQHGAATDVQHVVGPTRLTDAEISPDEHHATIGNGQRVAGT